MKHHYVFSKEGVAVTTKKSLENINYYIKKAKKLGVKCSKPVGGVELFDIDILLYPEDHIYDDREREQLHFEF